MATRSFINESEADEAKNILLSQGAEGLSLWLGEKLEKKLSNHPLWQKTRPYRLGSWARGELCAKSDIDLLFIGKESVVAEFVKDFQAQGIKIRYRVPADLGDWTQNVESFDILALLGASAFFESDDKQLLEQQNLIWSRGQKYLKKLFQVMLRERKDRTLRYDSISNYLEPNLKYGPGGLRDLEQGLMIANLFKEKFKDDQGTIRKLEKSKGHLHKIRHYLHLSGGGDVLIGGLQSEAAQFFKIISTQKFMSELESELADVSFYADWIAEAAVKSDKYKTSIRSMPIDSYDQVFLALKKNSSVMMQQHVRTQKILIKDQIAIGKQLQKHFNSEMSDDYVNALFRSNIMSNAIPHLNRLKGHVQHDQYHRYSVDAHTLQAVRETLRIKKNPKKLGRLSAIAKSLTPFEWDVLVWAALYHDLGKGLKGDHSNEGVEIVKRDFIAMGMSLKLTTQVAWIVKNHLLLSGAAFRKNPHTSGTWAELFSRGVKGRRIQKLTVFTSIDIRATNPDAWNDWKERLLYDLCMILQSPKASRLSEFIEYAEKKKVKVDKVFIENLDPHVIESLPREKLLIEYGELKKAKNDLKPILIINRKKEMWVRFHMKKDRPGIFLSFVRKLHDSGLSVQEAFVQTYPEFGVYDWFKVKSTKSAMLVRNLLAKINFDSKSTPSPQVSKEKLVRFTDIEIVSQDDRSAIISFRGKDQRGALLSAAEAIYSLGLEIQSAKVHTWGRQIDDVFTVKKSPQFAADFEQLRKTNT